jgi:hypothetical protein
MVAFQMLVQCAKPDFTSVDFRLGFHAELVFFFLCAFLNLLQVSKSRKMTNEAQEDLAPVFSCAGATSQLCAGCVALKLWILLTPR